MRIGQKVVPNFSVGVYFDAETLFAAFDMLSQCSIGKSESSRRPSLIYHINNSTYIGTPDESAADHNRHDCADFDWRFRRLEPHPTLVKLHPRAQCSTSTFKNLDSVTEVNLPVIHV